MKQIVVHAGLPKTGTSAIQRWLHEHRRELSQNGIHYPIQGIDANGVGPGNLQALLAPDATGKWSVSAERITRTLDSFHRRDERVLLLSSEFFAVHLRRLSVNLPASTQFIVYIRDPIELHESNYNQGVKRRGYVHLLNLGRVGVDGEPILPILREVPQLLADGVDLRLRPYHRSLFADRTILQDLFDTTELELRSSLIASAGSLGPVNASYTLFALEFKRTANLLKLGELGRRLDIAMQTCDVGPREYSLVTEEEGVRLSRLVDEELRSLSSVSDVSALEPLRAALSQSKGVQRLPQLVEDSAIVAVADFLRRNHFQVFSDLREAAAAQTDVAFPYDSFRSALSSV